VTCPHSLVRQFRENCVRPVASRSVSETMAGTCLSSQRFFDNVLTNKIICSILPSKRHTSGACGPGQHLSVARLIPVITTRIVPPVPTALPRGAPFRRRGPRTPSPPVHGEGSGEQGPIGGSDARVPSVHTRAEPTTDQPLTTDDSPYRLPPSALRLPASPRTDRSLAHTAHYASRRPSRSSRAPEATRRSPHRPHRRSAASRARPWITAGPPSP
jgi:hypothetical protein